MTTDLVRLRRRRARARAVPAGRRLHHRAAPSRPRPAAPGARALPRAARPARGGELPAGAVLQPRRRRPLRLSGRCLSARSQLPARAACDPRRGLAACLDAARGERAGGRARVRASHRRHAARLPRAAELRARRGQPDGDPGGRQYRRRRRCRRASACTPISRAARGSRCARASTTSGAPTRASCRRSAWRCRRPGTSPAPRGSTRSRWTTASAAGTAAR